MLVLNFLRFFVILLGYLCIVMHCFQHVMSGLQQKQEFLKELNQVRNYGKK